jgi:hypothetical protein
MGKKDTEENIWTNKGDWTVENYNEQRIKTNEKLMTTYKAPDIVNVIKI